ncbi:MAG: hypothetical protein HW386_2363 [Gammaproteobacteria bacterium]|nr:hypothetical protein [Gammaproteobacteria bacterium]
MRYAFVASAERQSVSIIDLHDRRLAETIQLQQRPGSIVASDRLDALIIAYPKTRQLGLIDLSSSTLKQSYYDLGLTPDSIKLDPAGDKLAVYDQSLAVLEIHNLQQRQLLVRLENIHTSVPLTFNRDGQYIFWVDADGQLHSSDLKGNTRSVKLAENSAGLSAMTRSVDGSMGFVSDALAGTVYVINLRLMTLIKAVAAGKGPGRPWGTADGQTILVPNQQSGTITAISTFTLEPLYTIETTANPVAINTGWLDTTAAVMSNSGDVSLISLLSKKIIRRLSLHGRPRAGVVTSDSRLLALPVAGSSDLYIFDMKSLSVEERIIDLPADLGDASLAISNNLCH